MKNNKKITLTIEIIIIAKIMIMTIMMTMWTMLTMMLMTMMKITMMILIIILIQVLIILMKIIFLIILIKSADTPPRVATTTLASVEHHRVLSTGCMDNARVRGAPWSTVNWLHGQRSCPWSTIEYCQLAAWTTLVSVGHHRVLSTGCMDNARVRGAPWSTVNWLHGQRSCPWSTIEYCQLAAWTTLVSVGHHRVLSTGCMDNARVRGAP